MPRSLANKFLHSQPTHYVRQVVPSTDFQAFGPACRESA